MCRRLVSLSVAFVAATSYVANAQVMTGVYRRNPNALSSQVQVRIAPQPLADGVIPYGDRTHVFAAVPKSLAGAQYVLTAMEDKDNPNYELIVTIKEAGTLYLFIDTRVGTNLHTSAVTANPVAAGMSWVSQLGFINTGMQVALDELADGTIDTFFSVFSLQATPGTLVLKAQNDRFAGGPRDRVMYVVAAQVVHKATNPVPADGGQVAAPPLLRWTPGIDAVAHKVYAGLELPLDEGDLVATDLAVPYLQWTGDLVAGTRYYWRVDEITPSAVVTGDVWTFRAASATAFDPVPADGAAWVDLDASLSWEPGKDAVLHDLYFSTNRTSVENGAASVYRGTHFFTTWTPPALRKNAAYFWRVDEIAADHSRVVGPIWSFTTVQSIPIDDPNLLGWWKMDEGAGAKAVDWSGHDRHARLADPAPTWAAGFLGGALRFAGSGQSVMYDDGSFLNGLDALTITAWVKSDVTNTDKGVLIFEAPIGEDDRDLRYDADGLLGGGRNVIKTGVAVAEGGTVNVVQLESSDNRQTTDWQHLAMVWSSGQALKLYIDGELDSPTAVTAPATGRLAGYSTMIIGKSSKDAAGSSWQGLIDEIRIYDKALTEAEIRATMRSDPLLAWAPHPANGVTAAVFTALPLTWQPGDEAIAHDVYLGKDRTAVSEATSTDATGIYRGRQTDASYTPVEPVDLCVRYYWRVDEVNADGSVSQGFVWDFMLDD
ncbi:MAG: LamG domain-containing protein [Phycisphaerales bacterium]